MRENVEFDANGTTLRGWFYKPSVTDEPYATVVMAHGFSALKKMGLNKYAERFSKAGLGCLVYDNRNLGDSDGEPRGEIDPVAQMRDYRYAVSYASSREDVDRRRIGIWGTSSTGGLVLIAAATDRRVKCVVSQVPYIHGLETSHRTNSPEVIEERLDLIDAERESLRAGNPPKMIPVCDYDPAQSDTSPGNRSFAFFHAFDDDTTFHWPNEFTVRSLELRSEYDALSFAHLVSPTPLLMIVAGDDEITPTDLALDAYNRALEPKKLHVIAGDHYRPYLEAFDESSDVAREWFVARLTNP
jgi:hypothetical protein